MKILLLDIENSPSLAHIWSLWDEGIPLDRLVESGYMLCYSAKWLGEDYIYFDSLHESPKRKMMKGLWKLLNEADAVVHYNGKRHDIPYINKEFLELGMSPPSPYKQIDLLETAKKVFKFPSNKLEYVCRALKVGQKIKHIGFELWTRCMANDKEAWDMMEEYNVNDVIILEEVYYKLRPWIKGHANYSLYSDDRRVCPNCGSDRLHKRGFAHTLASRFQRFVCLECGHWSKDNKVLNRQEYKMTSIQ